MLRPTVSRSASPWGSWPDFIFFFFRLTITMLFCNLQCNRWLVRSLRTNNHTLPSHLRLCSLFIASYDSQGLRWRYSNPPPHGVGEGNLSTISYIAIQFVPHRKHVTSPLKSQPGHCGPITINYPLIWDCVPSSSPLTTRRDYGGGILTRLHTGYESLCSQGPILFPSIPHNMNISGPLSKMVHGTYCLNWNQ
jgi:hypothetical protein